MRVRAGWARFGLTGARGVGVHRLASAIARLTPWRLHGARTATLAAVLVLAALSADAGATTRPSVRVVAESASVNSPATRAATASPGAVVDDPNCSANTLPANDDGSTDQVSLPFTLDFFGTDYSTLWVNNNGNVTFTGPLSTYTPFAITAVTAPMIAPFLADGDTRGTGSGLVTYGATTYRGRSAFCVDWPYVGYYAGHTDLLNDFQLLLVDRSDVAPGDFDIIFNYDQVQWETGDASGGSGGLGGTSAGVGFSNGDGNPNHYFELPGSLVNGAFLDSNSQTGLIYSDYGTSVPGRYLFHVAGGGNPPGGGSGLLRPWPAPGYGYNFTNNVATNDMHQLGASSVLSPANLNQEFTDWSQNVAVTGGQSAAIARLWNDTSNGVCLGLALSAGRFDGGQDSLFDPSRGRTDLFWSLPGSGPTATMSLPVPYAASAAFDQQFSTLVADDFLSQYSTQVNGSLQRQHYAYADPTSGFAAFESQLDSVMSTGTTVYDYSGLLSTATGTGFAIITLQTYKPSTGGYEGHAVLAYSAEPLGNGGVQVDVWDNNFPGTSYYIAVNPDGTWTYNAPYGDHRYSGAFSMTGAPGAGIGLLAILPLFEPRGLTYYPAATGGVGSGSLVDVGPGVTVTGIADTAGSAVDVEPVLADDTTSGDDGVIVDFPSDSGHLTLTGPNPSLQVRGANSYMTVNATGDSGPVTAFEDDQAGSVGATGASVALSVARRAEAARSTGASALTVATDGAVAATADGSGTMTLTVTSATGPTPITGTLYSGGTTPGQELRFTAQQVAAALAPAQAPAQITAPPPGPGTSPTTTSLPPAPGTFIHAETIRLRRHLATFTFRATGDASGFECALIRRPARGRPALTVNFHACGRTKTFRHLRRSRYILYVRAVGPGGTDATPAVYRFRIT